MTGYRLEELVGRTPALLRGPDTSPVVTRELWDELGSMGRSEARSYNRRADGSVFKAALTLVQLSVSAAVGSAIVCTMRDVTAENGMEEKLALLAQQANAARDTTILALASLAEQRDPTTGAPLQRIEAYTKGNGHSQTKPPRARASSIEPEPCSARASGIRPPAPSSLRRTAPGGASGA